MGGQGKSKKEIALLSGYTKSMAENAKYKIETTEGYKNAMINLAQKSGNLLMGVMAEFEARGFKNFSNKDLVSAINAVTGAWDKIDTKRAPVAMKNPEKNPLRAIFTDRVQTRTVVMESVAAQPRIHESPPQEEEPIDLDF